MKCVSTLSSQGMLKASQFPLTGRKSSRVLGTLASNNHNIPMLKKLLFIFTLTLIFLTGSVALNAFKTESDFLENTAYKRGRLSNRRHHFSVVKIGTGASYSVGYRFEIQSCGNVDRARRRNHGF